ncbi:MAG TPA: hypothetical protein DEP17_08335, partial [Lachnospiraceae bacterium]|nr:hypothetical protein [Lachnospiraceae bacterium]
NQVKHRFFVRVEGSSDSIKGKVKDLFGDIEEVTMDHAGNEYAFLTSLLEEQEMKNIREKLPEIRNMIRVRF